MNASTSRSLGNQCANLTHCSLRHNRPARSRCFALTHHSTSSVLPRAAGPPNAPRTFSSGADEKLGNSESPRPSPRWLTEINERIGKCLTFGLNREQTRAAGEIVKEVSADWRELLAGSEGFLTGETRRGLYRHEVIWGNMDSMHLSSSLGSTRISIDDATGHANNVQYNRWAESARVNWALNFSRHIDPAHAREWSQLASPSGLGMILRSIRTDFKFPMKWPDHISVFHKLRHRPTADSSSFILDVVILSEKHRRPAARCEEDIVLYDYNLGQKIPLPDFMLDKFRETYELQEQVMRQYGRRTKAILDQVKSLERASWDRPDAIEDMGNQS